MPDPDLSHLEYGEEDLFGSEEVPEEINHARPIPNASSSRASSYRTAIAAAQPGPIARAGPSTEVSGTYDRHARLDELRTRRRFRDELGTGVNVKSLRSYAMAVVRSNAARIWDVGELEYPLIAGFINELPMEQLVEIENNSPHIKKDTDWLWEAFLLTNYPLFHERCRLRKGEPRTSGWRRMYKKAKEDADERQQQAASRLAERYRQLEEEKAAKRIVFVDKVLATKRPRPRAVPGSRVSNTGFGSGPSTPTSKGSSAIAKARADAQRARLALTHASGKFIRPPPSLHPKSNVGEDETYRNPYLSLTESSSRLPAPRIPPPASSRAAQNLSHSGPPVRPTRHSPFPEAYSPSQANAVRAALPAHLSGAAKSNSTSPLTTASSAAFSNRFTIPEKEFKRIRRADVPCFEVPSPRPRTEGMMDFFGRTRGEVEPGKRMVGEDGQAAKQKEQRMGSSEPRRSVKTSHPVKLAQGSTGSRVTSSPAKQNYVPGPPFPLQPAQGIDPMRTIPSKRDYTSAPLPKIANKRLPGISACAASAPLPSPQPPTSSPSWAGSPMSGGIGGTLNEDRLSSVLFRKKAKRRNGVDE